MRTISIAALVCCSVAGLATAAANPPKKAATPPQKKASVATAPSKAAPSKAAPTAHPSAAAKAPVRTPSAHPPAKPGTRTNTATRRYSSRPAVRRAYAPQQPTSDRYREIQDALAAKGYLKTPSSGVWDKDSMAAMQRFQQDQKLDATGKLTARSLVALGLGPKNPATTVTPAGPGPSASNSAIDGSPVQ